MNVCNVSNYIIIGFLLHLWGYTKVTHYFISHLIFFPYVYYAKQQANNISFNYLSFLLIETFTMICYGPCLLQRVSGAI